MKQLGWLARLPLPAEPMDAWLSKWGSIAGGLLVLMLTVAVLVSQVATKAQLWLGVGLALLAFLTLTWFGVLSHRVHLAWHCGLVPWRIRVGELLALGAGLGGMVAGFYGLAWLGLAPVDLLIGALLVFTLAMVVICLGLLGTLAKVAWNRQIPRHISADRFDPAADQGTG